MDFYSALLAKANGGGGGSGGVLIEVDDEGVINKTWAECKSIIESGKIGYIIVNIDNPDMGQGLLLAILSNALIYETSYFVEFVGALNGAINIIFATDSPNGYPVES